MLSVNHLLAISQSESALRSHGETELADALNDLLTEQRRQASAHTKALKNRKPGKSGGQKLAYVVVVEPGGAWLAHGMAEAHTILTERLMELEPQASVPSARSMAAIISAKGQWWRMVEHGNGTTAITLRKATEAEVAQQAAS